MRGPKERGGWQGALQTSGGGHPGEGYPLPLSHGGAGPPAKQATGRALFAFRGPLNLSHLCNRNFLLEMWGVSVCVCVWGSHAKGAPFRGIFFFC